MIMNIILFVCFFPVLIILYFILRNEAKPKKNIMLGVTLPHDARQDAAVLKILKGYLRGLNIVTLAFAVIIVPVFLFEYFSIIFLYYITWMILAIILPNVIYASFNKKLKALKAEKGWYSEVSGLAVVDMKVAAVPKQALKIWWFIPPIIISFIPVVHTVLTLQGLEEFWSMLIVYGVYTLMVAAFYFMYRMNYHQKAEVVDENTTLSAALTQIRRYNWGKCWLITAWLTCIFDIAFWLLIVHMSAAIIATVSYALILLCVLMRVEFKTRKLQQKLTEDSGKSVYTDDDDKWIYGILYYNPNDSHFMVNRRVGIGTTVNLAKSGAKVLIAFTAVILLAMPLFGLWMMHEEFTPVRLAVTDTRLTAFHTKEVYSIELDAIESAEFIYSLPKGIKTNGTDLNNLLKGQFRFDGIGSCRLCLNPKVTPFIVIKTVDATYVFGSSDSEETYAVFDEVKAQVMK